MTENLQVKRMRLHYVKLYQILVGGHWKNGKKIKKATFMYTIKHNNLNKTMKDMFQISKNEFHNLRNNAVNFHIPKPKTNLMKKNIMATHQELHYGTTCQRQQRNKKERYVNSKIFLVASTVFNLVKNLLLLFSVYLVFKVSVHNCNIGL